LENTQSDLDLIIRNEFERSHCCFSATTPPIYNSDTRKYFVSSANNEDFVTKLNLAFKEFRLGVEMGMRINETKVSHELL
jgi:hypothetical protein